MKKKQEISITFSIILWIGIIMMLTGLIFTIFGIGNEKIVELEFDKFKLKTYHTGLLLLFLGSILSFLITKNLPKKTKVLGENGNNKKEDRWEKMITGPSIFLAIISLLGLILTFFYG